MKYSCEWLKEQIENGAQPGYLLFWGHTQKTAGVIDKVCLSQSWPSQFIVEGIIYPTVEHWMMAKKALLFNDKEIFDKILITSNPAEAKQLGRSVKNFSPEVWESAACKIVVEGNLYKFKQVESLRNFLLETADKIIAEASPVDTIWGIGLSADHNSAGNPCNWRGTNLLGFALMEVRDQLKN